MNISFEEFEKDMAERTANLDVTSMVSYRVYLGSTLGVKRYLEIGIRNGQLVELSIFTADENQKGHSLSLLADGTNPSKIIQSIAEAYETIIP